jgi:hypothetical protein
MKEQSAIQEQESSFDKDVLIMVSGLALTVFGAGLILSRPTARRLLGDLGVDNPMEKLMPDIARYFNLRSM